MLARRLTRNSHATPTPTLTPTPSSIDWLAVANHVFVLASCGYIIGNFFRSIVGHSLNAAMSEDVENALFLSLATLFVVDAALYYKCMYVAVWPVRRPRRLVEAEAEQMREEEAEEAEAADEVGALPRLTLHQLAERVRTVSGTSVSTTVTQDSDTTPGHSPLESDGWSDASTAAASPHAALDTSSSFAPYSLQVDPTTTSRSHPALFATGGRSAGDELVVDTSYASLLPLTSAGWGELVNIAASLVALASAVLPFFSSYFTTPARPHHAAVNVAGKFQLYLDNGSMALWFVDSLLYMHAWRHSLPRTARPSYFQPCQLYFWSNCLNIAASGVYVLSVVYGFWWTHSEREWRDEEVALRRDVQRLQRTLALGGDVLYLVCALTMEAAWYKDKCDDEVAQLKRRYRRQLRIRQHEHQRRMRDTTAVDSSHTVLLLAGETRSDAAHG